MGNAIVKLQEEQNLENISIIILVLFCYLRVEYLFTFLYYCKRNKFGRHFAMGPCCVLESSEDVREERRKTERRSVIEVHPHLIIGGKGLNTVPNYCNNYLRFYYLVSVIVNKQIV